VPYQELKTVLENAPGSARGRTIPLPGDAPTPTASYPHQETAVASLFELPVSGIVHLPTGAGKTRVALTWMARQLQREPEHRIVWASFPTVLIHQAMARLVDLSALFPRGLRFTWVDNAETFRDATHFDSHHITFVMRDHLTDLFEFAADGRVRDALTGYLRADPTRRITILYDECHQLGARQLQAAIRRYLEKDTTLGDQLRFIGLSATPLPTGQAPRRLLEEHVFPMKKPGKVTPNSADVFAGIAAYLGKHGAELVRKVKTVFQFKLKSPDATYTIDLKNGAGSAGPGETAPPECTLEASNADFMDMVSGNTDAMRLFTTGRLKITGNVIMSQKLDFLRKVDASLVKTAAQKRAGGGAIRSRAPEWNLMVHARVSNQELIEQKVLCPVNTYWQKTGQFDVPVPLLNQVINARGLRPPPRDGDRVALERYAKQFNSGVMSSPEIIDFLGGRIAQHLPTLGKTLVFAATIDAARRFVGVLSRHPNVGHDRVSLVHSRLDEEDNDLVAADDNPKTIAAFRKRGDEPCILVNVGMLTTGFDDPKVRTVVLARLTFSTNLFWQMIGRGTRGPATGGTPDCYVIDPVRLTELYGYANYQPVLFDRGYRDRDLSDDAIEGADPDSALPPQIPTREVPPPPGKVTPVVDSDLERMRPDIARAVKAFLARQPTSAEDQSKILLGTRIGVRPDGSVLIGPNSGLPDEAAIAYFVAERILRLEAAHPGTSFAWINVLVPGQRTPEAIDLLVRQINRIAEQGIRTETDWHRYMATRV
jgi:superfamily II DNA or RNA helicase/putative sterol carrier protein